MSKIPVDYKVDDNVPVPVRGTSALKTLRNLKPGQSILFPAEKRATIASTASRLKARENMAFVIKTIDKDSFRIWREA